MYLSTYKMKKNDLHETDFIKLSEMHSEILVNIHTNILSKHRSIQLVFTFDLIDLIQIIHALYRLGKCPYSIKRKTDKVNKTP